MSDDVGVVIPTIGRSDLDRAVHSVLQQTHRPATVVIVVDDVTALDAIRAKHGSTCTVIATRGGQRGSVARNLGVQALTTTWVAFLDDDDWWEVDKLEHQLATIDASNAPDRVEWSWTYTTFHQESGTRILPREPLADGREMVDYLVQRAHLTHGDGYVQTSSLLLRRTTAVDVLWDESLLKHQDWDLVVRLAASSPGVCCAEPLVNVQQGSAGSVSTSIDLTSSEQFLDRYRRRMSARVRADFVFVHLLRPQLRAGQPLRALRTWRTSRARWPHPAAVVVALFGLVERFRSKEQAA